MSLDLMPWFKTSVDARIEGLVSDMDYLENWWINIVQNRYGRKRGLFTPLMTPQGKKKKAFSQQFKRFLLLFLFLGLKD